MSLKTPTSLTSIRTLGALRDSGYRVRSVKDELRENLIEALREGQDPFPGVLGFEKTVIPQIQNAILGRHDFILLGLRGQAKTRILRLLPGLLDEYIPVVAGSDLNDDPFAPISKFARDLIEEKGADTPIDWLPRGARYGEKLATPDTSIADLIGDIDPIKAAHRKLTYADEEVIHFGIIPRTNRGIFTINELPDLQPRIQVGLLNIMEEQDIQIRGFNIRFPLDLLMVFSANPEDYTNRGSIITPLKDRIDSQIITHYPKTVETGIAITEQEAWQERPGRVQVVVPRYFREIIEQVAFEARASEYVDQNSGVSARMTRAALENLISAAERRALLCGESKTTVRPSDLWFIEPAITGKLELVYEGEQEGAQTVAQVLTGQALKKTFAKQFPAPDQNRVAYKTILQWFASGGKIDLHHDLSFAEYLTALDQVEGLRYIVDRVLNPESEELRASAMELVLEALHQHSLLGKDTDDGSRSFMDMMGSMLSGIGPDIDDAGEFDEDA
ncbi:MAG: magnesium chelatase subunit I [Rhodothermales bacterium]|jgi:magnesium chelatase subunit I